MLLNTSKILKGQVLLLASKMKRARIYNLTHYFPVIKVLKCCCIVYLEAKSHWYHFQAVVIQH